MLNNVVMDSLKKTMIFEYKPEGSEGNTTYRNLEADWTTQGEPSVCRSCEEYLQQVPGTGGVGQEGVEEQRDLRPKS